MHEIRLNNTNLEIQFLRHGTILKYQDTEFMLFIELRLIFESR